MPARTVKGAAFTIVVGNQRIIVKHVQSKGKRCRVIAPPGVTIESHRDRGGPPEAVSPDSQAEDPRLRHLRPAEPDGFATPKDRGHHD